MALIRIEPKKDEHSSLYFVEIYNPPDAPHPFVTTEPRYMTAAVAETDVIAGLSAMLNRPQKR